MYLVFKPVIFNAVTVVSLYLVIVERQSVKTNKDGIKFLFNDNTSVLLGLCIILWLFVTGHRMVKLVLHVKLMKIL